MSRPKSDHKCANAEQAQDGVADPAAEGADARAAQGAAPEAATGAAPASGAMSETAGAGTDSPGPAAPDQSLRGVLTPAELCEQLGVDAADVLAFNLDAGVIVTCDGQKHRLADV